MVQSYEIRAAGAASFLSARPLGRRQEKTAISGFSSPLNYRKVAKWWKINRIGQETAKLRNERPLVPRPEVMRRFVQLAAQEAEPGKGNQLRLRVSLTKDRR